SERLAVDKTEVRSASNVRPFVAGQSEAVRVNEYEESEQSFDQSATIALAITEERDDVGEFSTVSKFKAPAAAEARSACVVGALIIGESEAVRVSESELPAVATTEARSTGDEAVRVSEEDILISVVGRLGDDEFQKLAVVGCEALGIDE
ncbi:hypothetical protein AVEN_168101-1, partial [Araneus ventricosus]